MKSTGMVRRIDALGRVVLPKELRRTLDIKENDSLEIFTSEDRIILRKYIPGCFICGQANSVIHFGGKTVCRACISDLNVCLMQIDCISKEE